MDYLYRVLLKTNYPDWVIKEPENKPATPIINPDTGLEFKKNALNPVSYVPDLMKNLAETFDIPVYSHLQRSQHP